MVRPDNAVGALMQCSVTTSLSAHQYYVQSYADTLRVLFVAVKQPILQLDSSCNLHVSLSL